jgi:type VI secretion system protein ImpC
MADRKAAPKAAPIRGLVAESDEKFLHELITKYESAGVEPTRARDLVADFLARLLADRAVSKDALRAMDTWVAQIDQVLSEQLDLILHHPEFQKLEASWRGLNHLVMNTETGDNMKVHVLNVSKRDLLRDFEAAAEFTESALWKKVYQEGFGQYGGDPYGVLVGDYEFSRHPEDVTLLEHLSKVAAAAHAPFISSAGAQMFGMESLTQMPDPRDLAKIFDKNNPQNTKWLSFRDSEDSRFVALCMPHVLARLPYGRDTKRVDAFDYQEDVANEHDNYLWGNAAYAFTERLTESFASYHWCARITGPEGGGRVEGLPVHVFTSREGDLAAKCPTEVMIPDTRWAELSDLGFIPLVHCKNTDYAAFFSANSTQRPKQYQDNWATRNASLSSQLPYLWVTCRMAHYLKAMCRDKIGGFMSSQGLQSFLSDWAAQYVLLNSEAGEEQKAACPLKQAGVVVSEDARRPGCYKAVMMVQPHLHMSEVDVALQLVAELPDSQRK